MNTAQRLLNRYWSLVVAFLVPLLDAHFDRIPDPIENSDPSNLVLTLLFLYGFGTLICLSLLVHSWIMQRRFAKNIWNVIFWTHVLILPASITVGFGLQRVQTYTYELAIDYQRWGGGRWYQNLHFDVDSLAEKLFYFLLLDMILVVAWATVAVYKNKSSRPDSKPA
jgi:hypothetical protein